MGGAKQEEGTTDTEKAEKLDVDSGGEVEVKSGGGEGEEEKTEETVEKGEGDSSEEAKPSDSGEVNDCLAGDNETVEAVTDDATGNEKINSDEKVDSSEAGGEKTDTEAGGETIDGEAGGAEKMDGEDKADGQEASTSEQQPSSAEPPIVSVEEGDKKAEEPEKVAPAEEKKEGQEEEEEEEEEMVFDYDYEQLKSTPEMVNVTTSDMLTLLYPHTRTRIYGIKLHDAMLNISCI